MVTLKTTVNSTRNCFTTFPRSRGNKQIMKKQNLWRIPIAHVLKRDGFKKMVVVYKDNLNRLESAKIKRSVKLFCNNRKKIC